MSTMLTEGENTSGNSGSNNKRGDVELNSGNYNNIIGVSKISTIIDFTRQNNINRKKLFKKFPLNKYTASEINNYVATLIDSLKTGQYECKRLATSQLMETSNHGDLFWRCPGCDLPTNAFPNSYKCFCGKTPIKPTNTTTNRKTITPHGCGNPCGKKCDNNYCTYTCKRCGHHCQDICSHDDGCVCKVRIPVKCRCGRTEFYRLCSEVHENSGQILLCNKVCQDLKSCGTHKCNVVCCPATNRLRFNNNSTSVKALTCKCGGITSHPPVKCGTKLPPCPYDCDPAGYIKKMSNQRGKNGYIPKSESGPRRQKSLIRPERARRNQRRISRGVTNFAVDDSTERWSILPPNALNITANGSVGAGGNGDGGDERRLSRPLNRRLSTREPPKKRKWYKCQCFSTWLIYTNCVTCCIPPSLLSCFGMHDKLVQRAWREKMALVSIILILCAAVGFLTFGFTQALCGIPPPRVRVGGVSLQQAVILGSIYDLTDYPHPVELPDITEKKGGNLLNGLAGGKDISFLFQTLNNECKNILIPKNGKLQNYFPCNATDAIDDFSDLKPTDNPINFGCHDVDVSKSDINALIYVGDVFFDWDDVQRGDRNFVVHNGNVLDLGKLKYLVPNIEMIPLLKQISVTEIDNYRGRDLTYYMQQNVDRIQLAKCLEETIRVGVVDFNSIGCMITDVVTYVSLMVIVGVVLVRFSLAVLFGWILSWRLGSFREETAEELAMRERDIEKWSDENVHFKPPPAPSSPATNNRNSFKFLSTSRYSTQSPGTGTYDRNRRVDNRSTRMYNLPNGNGSGENIFNKNSSTTSLVRPLSTTNSFNTGHFKETDSGRTSRRSSINEYNHTRTDSMSSSTSSLAQTSSFQQLPQEPEQRFNFPLIHTILLVTCYSEGEQGLRTTLDSLANTDYPSSHKLIMVIADGIIKGSGNDKSTPDICLSLMNDFFILPELVQAHSYVAIADGKKRHNMARVYAGFYSYKDLENKTKRIPMVTVVKCGGPEEQDDKKPGNRGKRDSQIILMGFLQKVMFDERMTPLEYEFFNAVRNVSGVTPDYFEIVLMVDADTKIYPDSLTRMIACMSRDPNVMGLCGETKIANKTDSWVTAIQVFEYYINHHMQKAFESIFGGVTCLPGCFCMYRIKAPKGPNGYWVPILANPDIVEQYSENIVDTLHKKNLLLLGEDRYLTTLMLKTFPKRKMMFVPQAICKTIVPDTFKVLRSQRRRWINSTVHNLLELVLIPDLCGTFCFSMQFVIFMELVGTVVLPAAITFTVYLVIISFVKRPVPVIPLLLLAAVLGLPAVLILLTTRKLIYVGWMLVYLFSLPIWNFVLPVYAYWHFDDFSWGQTRVVEGEVSGEDHSRKEGVFDSSRIVMKKWAEWEREKRMKIRNSQLIPFSTAQMSPDENYNNVLSSASSITSTPATLTTTPPSAFASSRPTSVISNFAGFDKSYLQSAPPLPFNPRGGVSKRTSTRPRADSLMIPPPLAGGPILGNNNVFTSSPASSLMSSPLSSARSSVVYHDNLNHSHSNSNNSTVQNYLSKYPDTIRGDNAVSSARICFSSSR
ncbi:18231_t:CDS:10, partial [Entrophospora sp. SA101]